MVVRFLSTSSKADAGTVTVAGLDVATQAANVRESISLIGQFAAVDAWQAGQAVRREAADLAAEWNVRTCHWNGGGRPSGRVWSRWSVHTQGRSTPRRMFASSLLEPVWRVDRPSLPGLGPGRDPPMHRVTPMVMATGVSAAPSPPE